MTADELEEQLDAWRDEYEYGDFWKRDGSANLHCGQCRDLVEQHTERVPCCGSGHDCYDVLHVYVCHRCRMIGDAW